MRASVSIPPLPSYRLISTAELLVFSSSWIHHHLSFYRSTFDVAISKCFFLIIFNLTVNFGIARKTRERAVGRERGRSLDFVVLWINSLIPFVRYTFFPRIRFRIVCVCVFFRWFNEVSEFETRVQKFLRVSIHHYRHRRTPPFFSLCSPHPFFGSIARSLPHRHDRKKKNLKFIWILCLYQNRIKFICRMWKF